MLIRFKKEDGTEYPQWEEKQIKDIFEITRGYVLSAENVVDVPQNEKIYPVYSSQTKNNGIMGYYNDYLYEDAITWTTDGANAGTTSFRKGKFYCTNVCGVLLNKEGYANQCIAEAINLISKKYVSYVGNPKLMNNVMATVKIKIPCLEEQQKITDFLSTVDQKIKIQRTIVDDYEELKKGTMQKIFNQEIRFKDDDGNEFPKWAEKKLGDTLSIQRGGSPRPISSYITNKEDGLNWIKIGDVSPNTNVIKSTKEKIIPEGLKKTRQVFVGDLILSNSMSFGRPYILEINGCIHDGWLLIRKYEKSFDREFLCCLLASDEVKKQYEKLSAGSTVQNLNSELVQSVKVNIPCLEEQKKIADCLSALDRKIEAEKKILADLEELKKGLLQGIFNN